MSTATLRRPATAAASGLAVAAALGVVYVVWGSTYLAIRVGVGSFPPFLMAGVRFLVAGAGLYAFAIRRGDTAGDRPGPLQWRATAIVGGALLLGGNGLVSWGEQYLDSGLTALLIASVPLFLALFARLAGEERLGLRQVVGLGLGFGGVALLVGPSLAGGLHALGTVAMLAAAASWAAGSLYARRAPLPARPLVTTGMEMLCGGALLVLVGLVSGEAGRLDLGAVQPQAVAALAYLIVFGSLLAFTAYVWLLGNASTSLVGTYAFVNPVVAVVLGWLVLRERVTLTTLVAGAVIVAAVALIVTARGTPTARTPAD